MQVLSISEEKILYIDVQVDGDIYKQYRTFVKPIDGRIWEVLNGDNWKVIVDDKELNDVSDALCNYWCSADSMTKNKWYV
jgi:heterodisulfide reductase subunit A-like polyferredoxin